MQPLGASLARDPQLEAALRGRREELGIRHGLRSGEDLAEVLQLSLGRGRSQGLSL